MKVHSITWKRSSIAHKKKGAKVKQKLWERGYMIYEDASFGWVHFRSLTERKVITVTLQKLNVPYTINPKRAISHSSALARV